MLVSFVTYWGIGLWCKPCLDADGFLTYDDMDPPQVEIEEKDFPLLDASAYFLLWTSTIKISELESSADSCAGHADMLAACESSSSLLTEAHATLKRCRVRMDPGVKTLVEEGFSFCLCYLGLTVNTDLGFVNFEKSHFRNFHFWSFLFVNKFNSPKHGKFKNVKPSPTNLILWKFIFEIIIETTVVV